MRVRVLKLTVYVVDHDGFEYGEVEEILEQANYPNDCIRPKVGRVEARYVDWSDDQPINQRRTALEALAALFAKEDA